MCESGEYKAPACGDCEKVLHYGVHSNIMFIRRFVVGAVWVRW